MKYAFIALTSIALFFGAMSYLPANADETVTEQCVGQMSVLQENLAKFDGTFKPLSAEETSRVIELRGPPPVEPPFTFGIAANKENTEGLLVIYNDDCIKLAVGPTDISQINKFLGRVEASVGG